MTLLLVRNVTFVKKNTQMMKNDEKTHENCKTQIGGKEIHYS